MDGFSPQDPLTPYEAEHLVESLQRFTLEQVGTKAWLTQHQRIERLNAHAHRQAKDGTDEYVVDLLTSLSKVPVLVHALLIIELWKEKIFPLVRDHVSKLSALRSYVPIYHEATCINLLECVLFNRTSCEAAEDTAIDLIDYCYRKLVYITGVPNSELYSRVLAAKEAAEIPDEEVLQNQFLDTEFQICMCVISVTRFLTDHRSGLPLSATTRMLDTQDLLLCLVPLIEKAPWVKANSQGQVQKFDKHEWVFVADDDQGTLPELMVQCLLAVHNLVMDGECRARYDMHSYRKENLLRMRRFLNEVVFDQVPPLANLLRTLEELSITGAYTGVQNHPTPFVVEVVPEVRDTLVQCYAGRYEEVAAEQMSQVLVSESPEELKSLAGMFTMPDELTQPVCPVCRSTAEQRCSRCGSEWYCSRECQVRHWKSHKPLCDVHATVHEKENQPLIEHMH